jgi:hypothetical protein
MDATKPTVVIVRSTFFRDAGVHVQHLADVSTERNQLSTLPRQPRSLTRAKRMNEEEIAEIKGTYASKAASQHGTKWQYRYGFTSLQKAWQMC